MQHLSFIRSIIIAGCILSASIAAKAGITQYAAPRIYTVPGTPVVTTANSTAQVSIPYTDPSFTNVSVTNKVTFGVDHLNMNYIPTAGNIVITVKVEKWDNGGFPILPTITHTMTLKYQPFNSASPYEDKAVLTFTNAYKVKITLMTVNGISPATLPANLYLDNDILVERYYSYSGGAVTVNAHVAKDLDCNLVNDVLEINWTALVGAEEYQVEWTFVNDYGTTLGLYIGTGVEYNFKNNNTRVTVASSPYNITLAFEHGYVVYRVRAVGRDMTDPTKSIYGTWSIVTNKAAVSTVLSSSYQVTDHEANKNWQYSSTFAEEGKKKEVISYFDGSLRNRQSVTKVNTDGNTIVGETIYDHQGRPAVNVLPTPVPVCSTGTALKFHPAFNKKDASTTYTRAHFDLDNTDTCSSALQSMHASSGASNYYSSSNLNKAGSQAFVPDAELYPFSQIEYTPDNTGRIRRQGGVGKEFQLNTKHGTSYFYGWPQQPQLDRLFGSEVGDASHYKKNLVVDANGQVSISYLDQEGRTIATSLAGDAPKDATNTTTILAPLSSLPGTATAMDVDMFAKDANGKSTVNVENVQGDGIEFVSQLLVAYQSDYEFSYDIAIDKMTDPCLKATVCFNCVYDLEIRITDDCGRLITPITGTNPIKKPIGRFTADINGNIASFNTICTTPSLYNFAQSFKLNLPVGNYTVIKKLTVNKESRDYYVAEYLERTFAPDEEYVNLLPGCIQTYESFLGDALAEIDVTDCDISCSTCVASLQGSYATLEEARDGWVAAGKGTELDFDFLLEECNEPCKELSICETNFEMMLMDMSPDGQYAEFQTKANGDAPDMTLSIFSNLNVLPKNILTGTAYWRYPKIKISGTEYGVYIDETGYRTRIPVSLTGAACPPLSGNYCTPNVSDCSKVYYDNITGTYYTYPENLNAVVDFVANWNDNWAKSLVVYHPEYEYYISCLPYTVVPTDYPAVLSSDAFDNLLLNTITYAAAQSAGLVVAASGTPLAAEFMILFNQGGSSMKDPFLFSTTTAGTHIASLNAKMANYEPGVSMAALAAQAARCGTVYASAGGGACDDFGSTVSTSTTTLDAEWNIFKNMYLAEKQKQQKIRDDARSVTLGVYGYNGCIGNSAFNPFGTPMIPYTTSAFAFWTMPTFLPAQPCGWSHAVYYKNKKKRFYPNSNVAPPSTNYVDYQAYLQTGQCPLALDIQYLLTTLAFKTKLTATAGSGENIQLYPEFARDLYLALGGSASSISTFYWKATTTTDILNATISNGVATACAFTLNKTGAGITSWNDVLGISMLKYTSTSGGLNYFSAVAAVSDGSGGYNYKNITGSTCLSITGCTFPQECEPNDLAVDLSNLWTAIKIQGTSTFQSLTSVVLSPTYNSLITPAIKNALLTTSNNLLWKYDGVSSYELYDAAVPAKKLVMQFTSGSLTGVLGFINIKGGASNTFTTDGVTSTGVTALAGTMNLVNGATTGVPMGECGPPADILCEGDEYQLREDLEDLLDKVMLQNPFDYNPDLTLSTAYTTLLSSYVGPSVQQSTTKYDLFILNAANDYKEQILFNLLCKCKITLWHNSKATPALKFEDLVNLGTLTPYGPVASDNNRYQFYMYGTYMVGGVERNDTIYGESCFPIKLCSPTIAADTTLSPEVPYVNPCILQLINLATVNAQNQYNEYVDGLTTTIAAQYTNHCLSAVENLSAEYNDKEYHFTLYYYDQAGNLVKTVPPEGIALVPSTDWPQVISDRTNNTRSIFTNHRLATTYEYNSLNQLVRQAMPDHDMMDIWQFTLPNGLDSRLKVSSTHFINSTRGYLTGYIDFTGFKRGYLFFTDDAGATWKKMNDLVASDLEKVQMVSSTVGYAVGNHGIVLKTIDGGNTWDMFPTAVTTNLNDLYFTSTLNGVVVGANSVVLRTTDGAVTWSTAATGLPGSIDITAITYDTANFYISGNDAIGGRIYKAAVTSPSSTFTVGSWAISSSIQTTDIIKLQFVTATESYAVASDGNLVKSGDLGLTWVTMPTGLSGGFKDIYFKVPSTGPVLEGVAIIDSVAGKGLLWKTTDGGYSWTQLSANDGSYYNTFHFYQNDKGYAVGNTRMKRIVMTGGIGLVNLPLPAAAATDLQAVHFSDANKGWVASATRTYYTVNATAATPVWTSGPTTAYAVKELYFNPTDNTGLLLTAAGAMYKIHSVSSVYTLTAISTTEVYADMHENSTRVYAFSKTGPGNHVKYLDKTGAISGATVMTAAPGATHTSPADVTCISVTSTSIYTGGINGLLREGTALTSSLSWTDYTNTVTPLALYDIQAAGTGHVYAVGREGTLLQTTAGTTWKTLPTNTITQYNAMKFNRRGTTTFAACTGLIAGNDGLLLKSDVTLAGVVTNSAVALTTFVHLNDIALSSGNRAYIAGAGGTVISLPNIVTPIPAVALPRPAQEFNGVCMKPGTNMCLSVGVNTVIYYYNATSGAKINAVYTPSLTDASFFNPMDGYVIGEKSTIRYTSNGGLSWNYVLRPSSGSAMNGVSSWATGKAVIIGDGGYKAEVVGTVVTNGTLGSANLYDIDMIPGRTAYITGASCAYKQTAVGTYAGAWTAISSTPAVNFRALHIFRDNSVVAVGDGGNIYCHNGAWVSHPAGTSANLTDVFFHDDRTGYVVGDGGIIYRCSMTQNIWSYVSATSGLWTLKTLTGINGVTTSADVNLTTVDFPTRYHGFLGGYFTTGIPTINYARLLNDESGAFSTRFWYDRLGRMVVSQNTKQYNRHTVQSGKSDYSYTVYDALGRISEVGEKTDNTAGAFFSVFGEYINGLFNPNVVNDANLTTWINGGTRREVTKTYYDKIITGSSLGFTQDNLRKRVSSVTYEDLADGSDLTYQHASHYSYDIHGNVKTLWQEHKQIVLSSQRMKRVDYEYDLISGKVNVVRFQDGQPDNFYHYYEYDANNRVTEVYTSNYPHAGSKINNRVVQNNSLWSRDAKYLYYAHGPLARVETGEHQSQGIDYAYTLQGWIKGVNSNILTATNDMGNDGASTGSHTKTAKDAFGYSLNYYAGDYAAIDRWSTSTTRFESITASSELMAARYDLHNGNIGSMVTTITQPRTYTSAASEFPTILPQGTAYKYDQLNRILSMQAYANLNTGTNTWPGGSTYAGRYLNVFAYDANGNILQQKRNDAAGVTIDSLTYKYKRDATTAALIQNRLYNVNESVASGTFTDDIDNQTPGWNYSYDEIGNLAEDKQEQILRIEWTVYGKIRKIIRTSASVKADLEFKYDASGNRVAKIEKPDGSSFENGGSENPALWTTTYYTRDAQGNVMSTYKLVGSSGSFKLIERNMFGSSRLGTENTQIELSSTPTLANPFMRTLGLKYFEASNHLGNVLAVFTDKKIPRDDNSDATIDYFQPEMIAANDYNPFGSVMDGRTFSSNKYRYGFNGKEKDDEVNGGGNQYDYGFRIYNPRLGRFLSVDPLSKGFPMLTPYQFASNSPIDGVDLDGLEYLSSSEVRIKMVKGEIHLNLENCTQTTQNMWKQRDMACNNGTIPQPEGYIGGYPHKIGEISLEGLVPETVEGMDLQKCDYTPDVGTTINREFNYTKLGAPNKKNGTPDMRFKGNKLNASQGGIATAVPSAGPRMAGATLALNAVTWGLEQFQLWSQVEDRQKLDEHKAILIDKVSKDLVKALDAGMIPPEYQNQESMNAISSVILSGTNPTKDKKVYEIGIEIVKKISGNYKPPMTTLPMSNVSTDLNQVDGTNTGQTITIPTEVLKK